MGELFDISKLGELAPTQMVGDEEYPGLDESVSRHPTSRAKRIASHTDLDPVEHSALEASWGELYVMEGSEELLKSLGAVPIIDLITRSEE